MPQGGAVRSVRAAAAPAPRVGPRGREPDRVAVKISGGEISGGGEYTQADISH
jgi:hypothetical protein